MHISPRDTVTFRLDLAAVADATVDYDVAYRDGATMVTAMSAWLPRPEPVAADVPVEVTVEPAEGLVVTVPQAMAGGRLAFTKGELHWATYAVFGPIETSRIELPAPPWRAPARPAELTVARMPGRLSVTREALDHWVEEVARQTATFWGGFPVDDGLVVVIPTVGDDVEYGKVVAAGGAGMVILLGHDATEAALRRDWILVHEMFHLGFPSFLREGRWLDEGLATYFEPIIRARAGWYAPEAVWEELSRNLPTGLPAAQGAGLEAARDFAGVYWGGALVAFLADRQVRLRSGGAQGLEDGLRAVLASGGRATQVWSVERTLGVIDDALGHPTLRPLAEAHAFRGSPCDLSGAFARLGIVRRGRSIQLLDDAPEAATRRSMLSP